MNAKWFGKATGFTFANTHFASVAGNYNAIVYSSQPSGRETLLQASARSAMHDGDVRSDSSRCHRGTRLSVSTKLTNWLLNPKRLNNTLWVRGPPGIGKTAIARTAAEEFDSVAGRLAGSFFFHRDDPLRNQPARLVFTLAYRLTVINEDLATKIEEALKKDPAIMTGSLEGQWKKLIIEPVRATQGLPPSVIIIDGLDECGTHLNQIQILDLVSSCGPSFPIAFIITSRPEHHLKAAFRDPILAAQCCPPITLCNTAVDQAEMKSMLTASFAAIHRRHHDVIGPHTWPPPQAIDEIVNRSGGLYIYASILLKFVDCSGSDPQNRLDLILQRNADAAREAFSTLDELYLLILRNSHQPNNYFVQHILFLLTVNHQLVQSGLWRLTSLDSLAHICGRTVADVRIAVRGLHSIVRVPDDDSGRIAFHNQSVSEFLCDPTRSGEYYIDRTLYAAQSAFECLVDLSTAEATGKYWSLSSTGWMEFCCIMNCQKVPEELLVALRDFNFERWTDQYATVQHELCAEYSKFRRCLDDWPYQFPKFRADSLDVARQRYLTKLSSGNRRLGKMYISLIEGLRNLPDVLEHIKWEDLHPLVAIHQCITEREDVLLRAGEEGIEMFNLKPIDIVRSLPLGFTCSKQRAGIFYNGGRPRFSALFMLASIVIALVEERWRNTISPASIELLLSKVIGRQYLTGILAKLQSTPGLGLKRLERKIPKTFTAFHQLLSQSGYNWSVLGTLVYHACQKRCPVLAPISLNSNHARNPTPPQRQSKKGSQQEAKVQAIKAWKKIFDIVSTIKAARRSGMVLTRSAANLQSQLLPPIHPISKHTQPFLVTDSCFSRSESDQTPTTATSIMEELLRPKDGPRRPDSIALAPEYLEGRAARRPEPYVLGARRPLRRT